MKILLDCICISLHSLCSFTYHNSSALWVHSEELPWYDTSAATLAKRLLVYLFKHVLGGMVLQDHNTARVTPHHHII